LNLHWYFDTRGFTRERLGELVHASPDGLRQLHTLIDRLYYIDEESHSLRVTLALPEDFAMVHNHAGYTYMGLHNSRELRDSYNYQFNPDINTFGHKSG